MNKEWFISTDGNLHNITLANSKITPGETKSLTLILTKTMTNNNTGTVINTAEIGKASNNMSINDVDSIPSNQKAGEDDISTAEVIVSIKTGAIVYSTLGIILLLIIISFVILTINKRKEGEDV